MTKAAATPVRFVHGVGPRRAEAFEKLGIKTLYNLLFFFPRRYEDRTHWIKINEIVPSDNVTLKGEVLTLGIRRLKQMLLFELVVGDETGMIHAVWFNQPYLKNQFKVGMKIILNGRADFYQDRLQLNSPEYEILESEEESPLHMGRITPIYPLTEGLYQRTLRSIMKEVVDRFTKLEIHDFFSEAFREELAVPDRIKSVQEMHFPSSFSELEKARQRLVLDEFLIFELSLLSRLKKEQEKSNPLSLKVDPAWLEDFKSSLSFPLTRDQETVIQEIIQDCARAYPMNRLLQGEVGSGKTLVALFALMMAARSGHQACFLVPTEILAEQHALTAKQILGKLGIPSALLTASTGEGERGSILKALQAGTLPVVIGTHALLQGDVKLRSLALVIIDEQHKFGVRQRSQLLNSVPRPHQLVMSATPIPRTLALTLYGDLEVSTLKEMPKGRTPVKTYWIVREKQSEVLKRIRDRALAGDQAYLVFPLIDETERADWFAAKEEFERLGKKEFKELRLGLVHGRLPAEEREQIMKDFREGKINVLVATSVIEVGVDNPNACIMVIENAERFGLSQLHQLRGRVGRGKKESECFLFGEPKTEEGKRRLRILTKTNDGFVIAEEDLRLRGPGELLGTRQSGDPFFRVANLNEDLPILLRARQIAQDLLREDPELQSPDRQLLAEEVRQWEEGEETLS